MQLSTLVLNKKSSWLLLRSYITLVGTTGLCIDKNIQINAEMLPCDFPLLGSIQQVSSAIDTCICLYLS